MEVIRGREGDCRQEVCRTVERGGTRATQRPDPQGQAICPTSDEGPQKAQCLQIDLQGDLMNVTGNCKLKHCRNYI